jgi:hypothetical protein
VHPGSDLATLALAGLLGGVVAFLERGDPGLENLADARKPSGGD